MARDVVYVFERDGLTDFERSVIVKALEQYVEDGQDRHSALSAVSELHARSVATARDLALRFA